MKKITLAFAALLGLLALAPAARAANLPLTYVHSATWTLTGAGTNSFAFQNTSADLDVKILRIEIANYSTGSVTSGVVNFWVLTSTQVTHGGTSQVSFASLDSANVTAPTYISASTGPVSVQIEGKQNRQLPLMRPLTLNDDETATVAFSDAIDFNAPADGRELILPHGASRAIVIQQRQFGATDWTAGMVIIRIVYSVR